MIRELVGSACRAEATALECGDLSPLSDLGMAKTNDTETAMSWSTPKSESGDESPHSKGANEPAIINDISAEPAGGAATNIDATDCPKATSGNSSAATDPAAGANIREIFSPESDHDWLAADEGAQDLAPAGFHNGPTLAACLTGNVRLQRQIL
jgi:hypothetical protein